MKLMLEGEARYKLLVAISSLDGIADKMRKALDSYL
jgi:hypothetical protein